MSYRYDEQHPLLGGVNTHNGDLHSSSSSSQQLSPSPSSSSLSQRFHENIIIIICILVALLIGSFGITYHYGLFPFNQTPDSDITPPLLTPHKPIAFSTPTSTHQPIETLQEQQQRLSTDAAKIDPTTPYRSNVSYYPDGTARPFNLLDDDPTFHEMRVYFPNMLLLSSPYTTTLQGSLKKNQKLIDIEESSSDTDDTYDLDYLFDKGSPDFEENKKKFEKERNARQHQPDQNIKLLTPTTGNLPIDRGSLHHTIAIPGHENGNQTTTIFKFYPGATELPNVHMGLGYSWQPSIVSGHTKNQDSILQKSIIHTVKNDGLNTIHIQFDATSIYTSNVTTTNSRDISTNNTDVISKQQEILLKEVDQTFRRVLYQSHAHDITPIITLHNFQAHRDDKQWDWLNPSTIDLFVSYSKAIFPFFVEGGVTKLITIHGWEEYCRRAHAPSHKSVLQCQHHILLAHQSTIKALRKQCKREQLFPILAPDRTVKSFKPDELLHQHEEHKTTKLNAKVKSRLSNFCSSLKFTLGIQSPYYLSRSKSSGIAHIDYRRDYSTQTMTGVGRAQTTNPNIFDACSHPPPHGSTRHYQPHCEPAILAPIHANLISTGNTLNVLFKGEYAHSYRRLIDHAFLSLPAHQQQYKNEANFTLPTLSKSERRTFIKHQPDFLYVEYITTKYVYYDTSCLDTSLGYNQKNKNTHNYDLSCLRYSDFDSVGMPIGPHPATTAFNQTHLTSAVVHKTQHPFGPIHITRLVPRGLSLLLQYISDITYLQRYPKETYPLSDQSEDQVRKSKHTNVPIIATISLVMPHTEQQHHPEIEVIINNAHYNPMATNLRAKLYDSDCLHDYFRTNALALYVTEIAMAMKQRRLNIISLLYNNFIDPSHYDPLAKQPTTTGLVHVSDQHTITDKLSMLWFKSEALFHRSNGSDNEPLHTTVADIHKKSRPHRVRHDS